ncbi:hypothetical protein ABZ897_30130 [Nonomuraea sp. NPDC046802]|uniref:hypothetical protein n=1 Tax=Nonomuraea sp. NPDC046802 TaxID=3154919 RepID=UPI0033FF1523
MKRILALAALVVAAAVVFIAGNLSADEPFQQTVTGTRYAATVLIPEPVTGKAGVEVRVNSGDADAVAVSAVMPEMGHAVPEATAKETAPGRFVAAGEPFSMSGVWELSIRLNGTAGEETLTVKALISK